MKPVKKLFKIPVLSEYEVLKNKEHRKKQQDFITGFKDKWQNMKVVNEHKEREKLRERQFKESMNKAPERTYSSNPKQIGIEKSAAKKN